MLSKLLHFVKNRASAFAALAFALALVAANAVPAHAQIPTPAGQLLNTNQIFTDTWAITPSIMTPVAVFIAVGLAFLVVRRTVAAGKKASK